MMASQIFLWIAVGTLAILVAALARQVGILHERIAPAGALTLHQKVNIGEIMSPMTLTALNGSALEVGGVRDGRSQLLFFVSPDCPVCKSLLPVFKSAAKAEASWLDSVLAGDGDEVAHRGMIQKHGLGDIPLVLSEALGRSLGKIASLGLINSREHLESLFEAKERNVASIQDFLTRREKES